MQTETSIHNVATIEIQERRHHGGGSLPFWNRAIVITDVDGNQHTLQVYASGEEDSDVLKVAL